MFMLPTAQNQHPYLDLGEKMNSSLNDDFRYQNFVLLNQKLKKQKWQCSQNLDLNPTCVSHEGIGPKYILREHYFMEF